MLSKPCTVGAQVSRNDSSSKTLKVALPAKENLTVHLPPAYGERDVSACTRRILYSWSQ